MLQNFINFYKNHLNQTSQWLVRSIRYGQGGSCATFSLYKGWSKPYPETTGYLIPTLLNLSEFNSNRQLKTLAYEVGDWLLSIQNSDGSWNGGLHPSKMSQSSIFNTAQILNGLVALYNDGEDEKWIAAAQQGALWLACKVDQDGFWPASDYRSTLKTPSYYAHAAWPMLQVWKETDDDPILNAANSVLMNIASRAMDSFEIAGWGFEQGKPAFTHTIAYTIWGLMASAEILEDWETFGKPAEKALDYLSHKAEVLNGRLPGAFGEGWQADNRYICLTGNAQLALCLLLVNKRNNDLRYINTACKLVDFICKKQSLKSPLLGVRGGVAGSSPVWGGYMRLRYPNWAAKYHCDALMGLVDSLKTQEISK